MKYTSCLTIKSFRKLELDLFIKFFLNLKRNFINNIFLNFLLIKRSIIFKFNLNSIDYIDIIKKNHTNILCKIILNKYYFTYDNNINYLSILYKIFKNKYNYLHINNFFIDYLIINNIFNFLKLIINNSFSSMPTKRKHITLLRSPHSDKKSREQFVINTYKKYMNDYLCLSNLFLDSNSISLPQTCLISFKHFETLNN